MSLNGVKNSFTNSSFYQNVKKAARSVGQTVSDVLPNSVVGEKADKFFKAAGREISPRNTV